MSGLFSEHSPCYTQQKPLHCRLSSFGNAVTSPSGPVMLVLSSFASFSFPRPHFAHTERCSLPSVALCPCYNSAFITSAGCPHVQGQLGYSPNLSEQSGTGHNAFVFCFFQDFLLAACVAVAFAFLSRGDV